MKPHLLNLVSCRKHDMFKPVCEDGCWTVDFWKHSEQTLVDENAPQIITNYCYKTNLKCEFCNVDSVPLHFSSRLWYLSIRCKRFFGPLSTIPSFFVWFVCTYGNAMYWFQTQPILIFSNGLCLTILSWLWLTFIFSLNFLCDCYMCVLMVLLTIIIHAFLFFIWRFLKFWFTSALCGTSHHFLYLINWRYNQKRGLMQGTVPAKTTSVCFFTKVKLHTHPIKWEGEFWKHFQHPFLKFHKQHYFFNQRLKMFSTYANKQKKIQS